MILMQTFKVTSFPKLILLIIKNTRLLFSHTAAFLLFKILHISDIQIIPLFFQTDHFWDIKILIFMPSHLLSAYLPPKIHFTLWITSKDKSFSLFIRKYKVFISWSMNSIDQNFCIFNALKRLIIYWNDSLILHYFNKIFAFHIQSYH